MVLRNGKAAELRIVNWHVQELIPLKSFSLENKMCLFFLTNRFYFFDGTFTVAILLRLSIICEKSVHLSQYSLPSIFGFWTPEIQTLNLCI